MVTSTQATEAIASTAQAGPTVTPSMPRRLDRDIVYKRLVEMQTIFVERMAYMHQFLEDVENANLELTQTVAALREEVDALKASLVTPGDASHDRAVVG